MRGLGPELAFPSASPRRAARKPAPTTSTDAGSRRLPDRESADAWLRPAARPGYSRSVWLAPFLLFAACRLPSFFEPHWYTDEAGYATAARGVLGGQVLYSQIWTNKPPLQIWTVAVAVRIFGYREAGLHALTFLSGLAALAALVWIGRRHLPPRRALVCGCVLAVVVGLPFFDTELALPESLLVAPATWAGVLVLDRLWGGGLGRWPGALAAGMLIGIALGYQQTELADFGALGLALLLGQTSGGELAAYGLGALGTTLAWLVPAVWLAGPGPVAGALVTFYEQYAAASARGPAGLTLLGLAAMVVLGGAVAARRLPAGTWMPWLWCGADLGVAALIHRPYPHLLAPALAPAALAAASLSAPRPRLVPLVSGAVVLTLLAGQSGVEGEALLAYGGWYRQLLTAGDGPPAPMAALLDPRAAADAAATRFIRSHGLAGCPAVVWSADAWPYLTADLSLRLPTAPIYNDIDLEGEAATVARVRALAPPVIVASEGAMAQWPALKPLLRQRYVLAFVWRPDLVYLLRGLHRGC